jgi:hypothetical protein
MCASFVLAGSVEALFLESYKGIVSCTSIENVFVYAVGYLWEPAYMVNYNSKPTSSYVCIPSFTATEYAEFHLKVAVQGFP